MPSMRGDQVVFSTVEEEALTRIWHAKWQALRDTNL